MKSSTVPKGIKVKKIKKKRKYSDFEIKILKIQLDNLNYRIRDLEEKGDLNFEVLRKLLQLKKEDSDEYAIEFPKLLSQLIVKDPSRIEKLKEERDRIIKLLKEIEDKKKKQ